MTEAKPQNRNLAVPKTSQSLTQSWPKPTAARQQKAAQTVKAILSRRPDYGNEPADYIVGFTDSLCYIDDAELDWLADPRDGLATVCKFLPTIADVHEFLRNKRAKLEQFKPPPTHYHKAEPLPGPWDQETDYERKRRVVREILGYNPDVKPTPPRPVLPDDWSSANLKTPAAPPSDELRRLIADQEAA